MKSRKLILLSPSTLTNRTPEENLGLEYLSAESKLNGIKVKYVDAWLNQMSNNQIVHLVKNYNPEILGISPSMDSIQKSIELIDLLRKENFYGEIIMGGVYASFEAENIVLNLKNNISGVLTGEGDITFQKFIKNKNIKKIPGAVYFYKNKIIKNKGDLSTNIDLNDLPFPSREIIPLIRKLKTPSHIMGSRGCYGNCSFCSVACFQKFSSEKNWRGRNPENIFNEIKILASKGEDMFKFIDDNFFGPTNKKSRERKFAKLIISSGLKIRFRLSLRVNDVDDSIIKLFKKAGLFAVSLGVESFVQRKLNYYSKGTTVDQNISALKILKRNGIFVQMGHIMFDPFVTIPEIKQELHFLEKNKWAITKGICTELFAAEGTRITETIKNEVKITGKERTNYKYVISDVKSHNLYESLKIWSKENSKLYQMAIDPISSPKNIPLDGHLQFHQICIKLKELDILVAKKLILNINSNNNDLKDIVRKLIFELKPEVNQIENQVKLLYKKWGLNYLT